VSAGAVPSGEASARRRPVTWWERAALAMAIVPPLLAMLALAVEPGGLLYLLVFAVFLWPYTAPLALLWLGALLFAVVACSSPD